MADEKQTQAEQGQEKVEEVQEVSLLDQLLSKIDTAPRPQEEKDQIGIAIGMYWRLWRNRPNDPNELTESLLMSI